MDLRKFLDEMLQEAINQGQEDAQIDDSKQFCREGFEAFISGKKNQLRIIKLDLDEKRSDLEKQQKEKYLEIREMKRIGSELQRIKRKVKQIDDLLDDIRKEGEIYKAIRFNYEKGFKTSQKNNENNKI